MTFYKQAVWNNLFLLLLLCSGVLSQNFKTTLGNSENVPWTSLQQKLDPDQFQFIIVSDRTGGMQRGIFKSAIDKINLLQPDFVVSVGDLIDGYTENEDLVENQWAEFDHIIAELQMPFFYLAGNHDISNPVMRRMWREKLGPEYYHFTYKNTLFLCLSTEESPVPISAAQVDYFKNVLEKSDDTTRIIVLMHQPLWSYGNKGGYDKFEKLLENRSYTVFAGHTHHYLFEERNDRKHFILGTTGGGSLRRGADFGELDHIVWVTMTQNGPVIANLKLDGILDETIVSAKDNAAVQQLRSGNWLKVKPVVAESADPQTLNTEIEIVNHSTSGLHVTGKLKEENGLRFFPDTISQHLDANSRFKLPVTIHNKSGIFNLKSQPPVKIQLLANSQLQSGKTIGLKSAATVLLDWKHSYTFPKDKIIPDGKTHEWQPDDFYQVKFPQQIKEDWDWHGESDGWFQFAVKADANNLYLVMQAFDDNLLLGEDGILKNQDKFLIFIEGQEVVAIEAAAKGYAQKADFTLKNLPKNAVQIAAHSQRNVHTAELAISLNALSLKTGTFRLNIAYMDHDNRNNTKPSVLWWRPVWGSSADYKHSGTFYKN